MENMYRVELPDFSLIKKRKILTDPTLFWFYRGIGLPNYAECARIVFDNKFV